MKFHNTKVNRKREKNNNRSEMSISVVSSQRKTNSNRKKGVNFIILTILVVPLIFLLYNLVAVVSIVAGIKISNPVNDSQKVVEHNFGDQRRVLLVVEQKDKNGNDYIDFAGYIIFNNTKPGTLVYYIPGGVYIPDYAGEYSSGVSVSDLKYAGDQLSKGKGMEYTLWQLQNLSAFSFDSYIWMTPKGYALYRATFKSQYEGLSSIQSKDVLTSLYTGSEGLDAVTSDTLKLNAIYQGFDYANVISFASELTNDPNLIYSDMSKIDMVNTLSLLKGRMSDSPMYIIDIDDLDLTMEETLDNGETVRFVNYTALDKRVLQYTNNMKSRDLERELVKVEVFNGSGISKVAGRYSRKIKNSGCDVVRYENTPTDVEKTVVYVSDKERFKTSLNTVLSVFVQNVEVKVGRPDFLTTGDIVVVLGKDISKEMEWKK